MYFLRKHVLFGVSLIVKAMVMQDFLLELFHIKLNVTPTNAITLTNNEYIFFENSS